MGYTFEFELGNTPLRLSIHDQIHLFRNNWDCQRHSNANYELHIILRGKCRVDVEEYRQYMDALDAIIIAPGQFHLPAPAPEEFERFLSPSPPPTVVFSKACRRSPLPSNYFP